MDLFLNQVDKANLSEVISVVNSLGEEFDAKSMWQKDELSFNLYRKEIRHYKWIDYKNEQVLLKRIQNGDNDAFEQLVLSNLGFVINIAKRYQNHGLTLNDLISEGNIGLMNAAKKCEAERICFKSYAIYHIRSSIMQAINKYGNPIHYSNEVLTNFHTIQKYICKFQLKNGYTPSYDDIEEDLGLTIDKIFDALSVRDKISLDYIFECCSDIDLFDAFINLDDYFYPVDCDFAAESLAVDIENTLDLFSEREKYIVIKSFGINCEEMELDKIGNELNLSRERARQIRENTIKKLRTYGISLKEYL